MYEEGKSEEFFCIYFMKVVGDMPPAASDTNFPSVPPLISDPGTAEQTGGGGAVARSTLQHSTMVLHAKNKLKIVLASPTLQTFRARAYR